MSRNSEELLAENNTIDAGQPQPLRFTKSVAPAFLNNRNPAGNLIRGYDETALKNRSEVESVLEDIALLSL